MRMTSRNTFALWVTRDLFIGYKHKGGDNGVSVRYIQYVAQEVLVIIKRKQV